MAKRPSNSGKAATSGSDTSLSGDAPSTNTNRKITLRIKPARNYTAEVNYEEDTEKEERPKSRKRPSKMTKRKTKRKNIDPNKPKKPPTAFFYFLEDFRRGYQEENPQVKSMRDIGKACGEKWKTMTYEEKVKYYDIATRKRAEFDKAMEEYITQKESGEDALSEDSESESDVY